MKKIIIKILDILLMELPFDEDDMVELPFIVISVSILSPIWIGLLILNSPVWALKKLRRKLKHSDSTVSP